MSEVVLLLVIVALVVLIGWDRHEARKERQKFIQAIMSKSAQDLKDFELADKIQFEPPQQFPPDLVNVSDLSDEEFQEKVIGKEVA